MELTALQQTEVSNEMLILLKHRAALSML